MPAPEWPHRARELARRLFDDPQRARAAERTDWPSWSGRIPAALGAQVSDEIVSGPVLVGGRRPGPRQWGSPGRRILPAHRRRTADTRLVWETHRLQYLQTWALAANRLGDDDARRAVKAELTSWFRANPPGVGDGWASSLEVALRAISLLRVAAELPELPLRAALGIHARWLERFPSRLSSANSHAVGELAARLALSRWAGLEAPGAAAELRDLLRTLIRPDGSGAEGSPHYLAFTLEWALLARKATSDLAVDDLLARGAAFLDAMRWSDGECVRVGDIDDGQVLRTAGTSAYGRSVAGAVSAALDLDWRPAGWVPDLRAELLGATSAAPPRPRRPARLDAATVLQAGSAYAIMVHGEGLPPLRTHAHSDALSVLLEVGGQRIFVDRGSWRYGGAALWRRYLRSTAAHNTIGVTDRDQSRRAGDWGWGPPPTRTVSMAGNSAVGEHDGYADLGLIHRRTVVLERDRLLVEDVLQGTPRQAILRWHLAPELELRADGQILRGGAHVAQLQVDRPWRIARQTDRPGAGAHAPRYGELVPACTVVVELSGVSTVSTRVTW